MRNTPTRAFSILSGSYVTEAADVQLTALQNLFAMILLHDGLGADSGQSGCEDRRAISCRSAFDPIAAIVPCSFNGRFVPSTRSLLSRFPIPKAETVIWLLTIRSRWSQYVLAPLRRLTVICAGRSSQSCPDASCIRRTNGGVDECQPLDAVVDSWEQRFGRKRTTLALGDNRLGDFTVQGGERF